jgi:hypothetical protein
VREKAMGLYNHRAEFGAVEKSSFLASKEWFEKL